MKQECLRIFGGEDQRKKRPKDVRRMVGINKKIVEERKGEPNCNLLFWGHGLVLELFFLNLSLFGLRKQWCFLCFFYVKLGEGGCGHVVSID